MSLHLPHHIPHPHVDPDTRELLWTLVGPALCILGTLALMYALTVTMGVPVP